MNLDTLKETIRQEQWEERDRRHKFNRRHEEIMAMAGKYGRAVNALEARLGIKCEGIQALMAKSGN